jgi:hypothetical protein
VHDPHPDSTPQPPDEDELRLLIEQARRGEAAALPALRAALDARPELWERYGDLASHSQRAWIDLIAGNDRFLAEALGRKVGALAVEMAGPDPTPLERMLVARITANWLQLHHAEAAQAQSGAVSLGHAEFTSKHRARADKSFMMAIASLATIRRLLPADTSKRLPTRPGGHDPADGPRDEHPSASVDAIPEPEDEDRFKDLARPGPLAVFDRPSGGSNIADEPDLPLGERGRSAS